MISELFSKDEKKVEYVELIYDLIFVYIIGRNNSILQDISGGFLGFETVFTYILCTLAVIQIWNFTTYYINLYGRNSVRDCVFLFINMYLVYFLAEGTRLHWQGFYTQYHVSWALILINVGIQYLIEQRNHKGDPVHTSRIKGMARILFIMAAVIICSIFVYDHFGTPLLSAGAIAFGMCATPVLSKKSCASAVDFGHLTERAMLYIVFTFGEMIIAIAGYFDGDFNLNSLYFSLMGFLIVVGLFLSYGIVYDHIVDRELTTNGMSYMLLHVLLIFGLNNITNALEFMREEEIDLLPKISMLVGSFILYYVFLLILAKLFAKKSCRIRGRYFLKIGLTMVIFTVLMIVLREHMLFHIALTAVFVFVLFGILYRYWKKLEENMNKPYCEI